MRMHALAADGLHLVVHGLPNQVMREQVRQIASRHLGDDAGIGRLFQVIQDPLPIGIAQGLDHFQRELPPIHGSHRERLVAVVGQLLEATPHRGWRAKVAQLAGKRRAAVRGLYLWGSVGRGKTLLMDLFFNALPFRDKRRQHFHRFMATVHDRLKAHRNVENPLELVAEEISSNTRVICFDELAVTDIADAMLLGNLFAGLFARGVTLAATSNIVPDQLYAGGLQRQRFLPTIALLKEHCEVLHVDGGVDYRLRALERADVYQTPPGNVADQRLTEFFESIAPDEGDNGGSLELNGREIAYRRAADGVIWFDFRAI